MPKPCSGRPTSPLAEHSIDAALDFFSGIVEVLEAQLTSAQRARELNATRAELFEARRSNRRPWRRAALQFQLHVTDAVLRSDAWPNSP